MKVFSQPEFPEKGGLPKSHWSRDVTLEGLMLFSVYMFLYLLKIFATAAIK